MSVGGHGSSISDAVPLRSRAASGASSPGRGSPPHSVSAGSGLAHASSSSGGAHTSGMSVWSVIRAWRGGTHKPARPSYRSLSSEDMEHDRYGDVGMRRRKQQCVLKCSLVTLTLFGLLSHMDLRNHLSFVDFTSYAVKGARFMSSTSTHPNDAHKSADASLSSAGSSSALSSTRMTLGGQAFARVSSGSVWGGGDGIVYFAVGPDVPKVFKSAASLRHFCSAAPSLRVTLFTDGAGLAAAQRFTGAGVVDEILNIFGEVRAQLMCRRPLPTWNASAATSAWFRVMSSSLFLSVHRPWCTLTSLTPLTRARQSCVRRPAWPARILPTRSAVTT